MFDPLTTKDKSAIMGNPRMAQHPQNTLDYALIPLTQGFFAKIDLEDYERVSAFSWCYSKGHAISRLGKSITAVPMSRFIMEIDRGELIEIDHKNRDTLDNRKLNLRTATRSQNNANRAKPPNCTSEYRGVIWTASRWRAQIRVNGQMIYLGRFKDEIEAAKAYDKAAREAFGEFANTNF